MKKTLVFMASALFVALMAVSCNDKPAETEEDKNAEATVEEVAEEATEEIAEESDEETIEEFIQYADKANERLRRKYLRIMMRSSSNIAKTAIARELACFIWGMMTDHII